MNLTLFGATGDLGRECLLQALDAGHTLTILARTPAKLPPMLRERVHCVEGDALRADDVERAISPDTDAVLFAIGIDAQSPENLCTDATRRILEAMRKHGVSRFVWCGGGSNFVADDVITFGAGSSAGSHRPSWGCDIATRSISSHCSKSHGTSRGWGSAPCR